MGLGRTKMDENSEYASGEYAGRHSLSPQYYFRRSLLMFKHLLVPLDGSEIAEQAVAAAIELAHRFNSQITLLRVTNAPYLLTQSHNRSFAELITSLEETERQEATHYLSQLQEQLSQRGLNCQFVVTTGEPVAEIILEKVSQLLADTIVMGTHGWSGLRRWVYGSVADRVLRHAEVPVLLVRGRETSPTLSITIPPIETFADMHTPIDNNSDEVNP